MNDILFFPHIKIKIECPLINEGEPTTIMPYYIKVFFLLFFSSCVNSAPFIGIGSMHDVLAPGQQSLTKRIHNMGDTTAFVRVEVLEIDATKKGVEQRPADLLPGKADTLNRNRLIVTPMRLIVPPGGFQSVRLLYPGERDREHYYRIRFIPVMPGKNDGFGLNEKEIKEYKARTIKAGVNILAGYGSLAFIQPQSPRFNTVIETKESGMTRITNKGNATIVIENARECRAGNIDCSASSRFFILPGRSQDMKIKPTYHINATLVEGNDKKKITLK